MAIAFWAVLFVLFAATEVHTNAFVSVFLGLGSVVALVLAIAGVPFFVQSLVFVGGSAAGITALRPLALRKFAHHRYEIDMTRPTHTAMTHLTGKVEEAVGDELHPGRVRIQGETWRAVTDWPEPIPSGAAIVVDRAHGTTLWVNPR
jgi:membrane protein implicated in regulation of membrane protease activity